MIRVLVLLAIIAPLAYGQRVYYIEKETVLTGTAEVITVHLPTGSNRTGSFIGATVVCSAACAWNLERDGAAPTGTSLTVSPLNSEDGASQARAYYASNVGAGTHIKKYSLLAAGEYLMDLPEKGLLVGKNLTIRFTTTTGVTVRVFFIWKEY